MGGFIDKKEKLPELAESLSPLGHCRQESCRLWTVLLCWESRFIVKSGVSS